MNTTTIFNSYSIALPTVRVAATAGSGLLARMVEALARRVTQSVLESQPPQTGAAARVPHWSVDAALRQQGMQEWLSSQQLQRAGNNAAVSAAEQHKRLWLELVA